MEVLQCKMFKCAAVDQSKWNLPFFYLRSSVCPLCYADGGYLSHIFLAALICQCVGSSSFLISTSSGYSLACLKWKCSLADCWLKNQVYYGLMWRLWEERHNRIFKDKFAPWEGSFQLLALRLSLLAFDWIYPMFLIKKIRD